jgi:hypothetical protein
MDDQGIGRATLCAHDQVTSMRNKTVAECPHCRTKIDDRATVCVGCGAKKFRRGFPGGSVGGMVYALLWLGIPITLMNAMSSGIEHGHMSEMTGDLMALAALAIFVAGIPLLIKLNRRGNDPIWYR